MWVLHQPGGWPLPLPAAVSGWAPASASQTAAPPAATQQAAQASRKRCRGSDFAAHQGELPAQRVCSGPSVPPPMPESPAASCSEQTVGALPLALLRSLSLDLTCLGSLDLAPALSWSLPQPSEPAAAGTAGAHLQPPPSTFFDLDRLLACAVGLPPLQEQAGWAQQLDEQLAALVPQLLAAWSSEGALRTPPLCKQGHASVAAHAPAAAHGSCSSPGQQQHNSALFAAGVRQVQSDMAAEDVKQLNDARAFLALFPSTTS